MFASPQTVRQTADASLVTGVWSWDISQDRIYGDATVASLCNICPEIAQKGIPASVALNKIHPDDRELVLENIRATISGGVPGPLATRGYRLHYFDEIYVPVTIWGNAFANSAGQIHQLIGVISVKITDDMRLADFMAASSDLGALDEIQTFCQCAEAFARSIRREDIAEDLKHIVDRLHSTKIDPRDNIH